MFQRSYFGSKSPVLNNAWMGQGETSDQGKLLPRPLPAQRPDVLQKMGPTDMPQPTDRKAQIAERIQRGEDRICDMLKKFSDSAPESPDEGDARSRIFWSYIRHQGEQAGQSEDVVSQQIIARCPGMQVPPKPPTNAKPLTPPGQQGFHGKTQLSYQEAKDLSELLDVVLQPLSPEEAAKEIARKDCLRDIVQADGFPIVDKLQQRLKDFIAAAKPTDTFTISQGEVTVTGKAVECAEALGRIKVVKTVAYTGGAVAGGAGLLWLFGLL